MVGTMRTDTAVIQRIKDLLLEGNGAINIQKILEKEVKDPKSSIYNLTIPSDHSNVTEIKLKLESRPFIKGHKSSKTEGVTGITAEEKKARGKVDSTKVTESDYLEMQEFIKENPDTTRVQVAKKWGVSDATPYDVEKRYSKKHGKLNWKVLKGSPPIKPYVTESAEDILKVMKENPDLKTGTKIRDKAGLSVKQFHSAMAALKSNTDNRFDIPDNLVDKIKRLKGGTIRTVEETLAVKKIINKQQVKDIFRSPRIAVTEFFEKGKGKGTAFEHAFPRTLINYKIGNKFIFDKATRDALEVTGTRTSPYLNFAKVKIDNLQRGLVNDFLADEITLNEYRKGINKLRKQFKDVTGGYEIGYIDFDKNKNPKPVTNLKKATLPTGQWGGGTAQKITPFANAKYTVALLNNFLNDSENDIFSSLKRNMDVSEISPDTVNEYSSLASDYEKAKPHLYNTQKFRKFADNNLDNSVVKVLIKAEESVKPGDTREIGDQRILKRYWGPEGRPELGLRYKILNDATLNKNNICQVVFGKVGQQKLVFGKARGGLADGGCGPEMKRALETQPDDVINKVSKQAVKPGESTQLRTMARQILSKIPKGGRLGAILAGAGAVGLGTAALMGDAEADINPETDTMVYNPVEGRFVDKENGDPEDQMGKLNWIADNPVKSSLLAMPLAYGIGAGANKLGAAKTAAYLTNWKAVIPAMMIPEKLWQYREGESLAEMTTDPWNAIWALGIDSTDSAVKKAKYYMDLAKMPIAKGMSKSEIIAAGKIAFEKTGANILGADFWKDPKRMTRLGQSITSPAAAGTDLAFQSRFKPAMGKMADVFGSQVSGKLAKRGIGSLAKRALMMTAAGAGLAATGVAGTVLAPLMLTLFGVDYLREQFGDYSMGKKKIDRLRSMGKISEEDADNYMSLLMQENLLPFGVGNRLFGKDEMMIGGQILDPDDQRTLAAGMEDEIDSIKESDKGTRAKWRQQEFFDEGGRVGMKFGGSMDRRGFLKWLAGITAGAYGAAKGLWKPGTKKVVEEVAKETLTTTKPEMWVPRLIAKIKAEGKLLEMADKKYVQGDIYEALINGKKVRLESNPVSGQHQIDWQAPDYDSEMTRTINFSEGELITEGEMIGKKTSPEVTFNEPDRSTPYRDDFTDFDWVNDSDQVLDDMQRWIGIEDVKVEPTGPKTSNFDFEEGGYDEFNQGGEVETGAIARRQSAVPPLSGPDPQAQGIAGLFSQPKQVRVG